MKSGLHQLLPTVMLLGWALTSNIAFARPVGTDDVVSLRSPSEVKLSPDGKLAAYVLTTPLLQKNGFIHDIYVAPTDGSTQPRQLTHNELTIGHVDGMRAMSPQMSLSWSPDSRNLIVVSTREAKPEIVKVNIADGTTSVIDPFAKLEGNYDLRPSFFDDSIAYSPDGKFFAFLGARSVPNAKSEMPMQGIEADEDWRPEHLPLFFRSAQLFVMDIITGNVRTLTDEQLAVASFQWSPDGRRLALEVISNPEHNPSSMFMRGDIFVIDAETRKLTPIVTREGSDRAPTWSPDGTSLAFYTQRSKLNWNYLYSLAVAPADGRGGVNDLDAGLDFVNYSRGGDIRWSSEHTIDVTASYKMSAQVFRIDVLEDSINRLTPHEDRYYSDVTKSRDGSMMAFVEQGVAVPPDIYVTPTDRFAPRRLTHLNPNWDTLELPSTEIVKWRSKDDRWDIHGLLIKPSNYVEGKRYPMITAIQGGPAMVPQFTEPLGVYPLVELAEQGYVIFLPNSRGRPGFGADFAMAIRDERSYVLNPLGDVESGVDAMVARGIANPKKLGVVGFSYGGTLTANLITRTNRFKTAIYGEGSPDLMKFNYADDELLLLARDMMGFPNPFEPATIKSRFDQTAIFRLDKVKTPVLIESGEASAWETDRELFRGLRYYGVPSEWIVYPRAGHGWMAEPQLLKESKQRDIDWLNYWILDKPYPDAEKQKAYDAWKTQQNRKH